MDTSTLVNLLLVIVLVMGNAFFVGSEIALTSARRSRIKQLADNGHKAAKVVQLLHHEPERFYSVTQIGITLVSLGLGAIGITTMEKMFDPVFEALAHQMGDSETLVNIAHTAAYAFGFIIISFLHVVGGELAPKVLAFHKAETLSLAVAWLINTLYRTFSSLIWIMNKASEGLLWVFGQRDLAKDGAGHFSISEDEIRTILTASEKDGVLNAEETQMIRGVFDLDEHRVRDAMVPRTDITAISQDASVADALELFRAGRHARYPIYDGSLDNMVGMVAIKELLNTVAEARDNESIKQTRISDIMLPLFLIPETRSLSELLKDFKRKRQQMAIVLDEYGGTAGLITLEDILEEIVGDYADEFTQHRYRYLKKLDGSQYIIDASVRLTDLEALVDFPFPEGDYVTLGGLVYDQLGAIPQVGTEIKLEGARMEVLAMDKHRVTKVLFQDLANMPDGSVRLADETSPPNDYLREDADDGNVQPEEESDKMLDADEFNSPDEPAEQSPAKP